MVVPDGLVRLFTVLADELVADSGDGEDEFRLFGVLLEFLPQAGDVGIDSPGEGVAVVSPDGAQQFIAGNGFAGALDEIAKKLKFACGEIDGFAFAGDFGLAHVDANGADIEGAVAGMDGNAAQQDLDAGQQFCGFKGLGDVVVGAQLEAHNLVDCVIAHGEDQDGGGHPGAANVATDVEPAFPGKVDIEDDEVKRLVGGSLNGLDSVRCGLHNISLCAQAIAQSSAQGFFVFHDKDAFIHSIR